MRQIPSISNIDLSANIFQCKSSSTNTSIPQCDDSFPYEYQSSCLRNCSDTQNLEIFGNKTTYFLEYTVGGNKKKYVQKIVKKTQEKNIEIQILYLATQVVKKLHINLILIMNA
jgi:hypothetical protein